MIATIEVNGFRLTNAQSETIRVAVASWLTELDDPAEREALGPIADAYRARLSEIQDLIFRGTVEAPAPENEPK